MLLGPRYAILRPEFNQYFPFDSCRPINNILLTFGGGNDFGLNQFVLSTLLPLTMPHQKFIVISGSTNPSNDMLSRWIQEYGQQRVMLHINPKEIAPLFASCDIAVMAVERLLMKLPAATYQ